MKRLDARTTHTATMPTPTMLLPTRRNAAGALGSNVITLCILGTSRGVERRSARHDECATATTNESPAPGPGLPAEPAPVPLLRTSGGERAGVRDLRAVRLPSVAQQSSDESHAHIFGTSMMCAFGVPGNMIHGAPSMGLDDRPVDAVVAPEM